jgi:hypothetical protein
MKLISMVRVRERTIPTEEPPLVGEVIANFLRIEGCHVVNVTDPYGRIVCFLDRRSYFSIKWLLSCTHEAEWTPFQTHYFFFSGNAGNRDNKNISVTETDTDTRNISIF